MEHTIWHVYNLPAGLDISEIGDVPVPSWVIIVVPVAPEPGNLLVPGKLPGDGVFNSIVVPPPENY